MTLFDSQNDKTDNICPDMWLILGKNLISQPESKIQSIHYSSFSQIKVLFNRKCKKNRDDVKRIHFKLKFHNVKK